MKKFFNLVYGLLVIALVSCAASPTLTPPNSTDPIVVYHRSGGFGGFDETWTIYADGRIDHTGRGAGSTGQLTADRIDSLIAQIRSIDLTSIKDSYVGINTCCDRFIYEITITLDGKTKSIKTIDGAQDEPTALTQLLTTLNDLLK
jgi:hypothetical protein